MMVNKSDFGQNFIWGVGSSAYQTEGAYTQDGKGSSIWDKFSDLPDKIRKNHHGKTACNFYNHFIQDLILMDYLGIRNFRASIAWSRIFPDGIRIVNQKGIDYYNFFIDYCLELGIRPWLTLYHWDLPQALEDAGGWTNRNVIHWFEEYIALCTSRFGDRVKDWIVLNDPLVFTGAGYFLGTHAPGRKGLSNFLPAAHHAVLAQAMGTRIIRSSVPNANIGSTFSFSPIYPADDTRLAGLAARRVDVAVNRLFIEPFLGLGYPVDKLHVLCQLEKYMYAGDEQLMVGDHDFLGVQNHKYERIKHHPLTPYIYAKTAASGTSHASHTSMDWEIYQDSVYEALKRFSQYRNAGKLIVTESGAAYEDQCIDGRVDDHNRIDFYQHELQGILRAKNEGINVEGFFARSFLDGFEWAEGYNQRFGLVHTDFSTQKRSLKASGLWYKQFLESTEERLALKTA